MSDLLRVLIVEDSEDDTLLIVRELRKGGYDLTWHRVCTAIDMEAALQPNAWDIIICDYSMPAFNGLNALRIVQETGFDLPFIIVSGAIGEDVAVAVMKAGAHDYLMKENLTRLSPAVARELHEAEERRRRRKAEDALLAAQRAESLGVMASGVAHDFNNLLVAFLTQNALAKAKLPSDSPANEHINKAIKAAERASDLTRQMLHYAGCGRLTIEDIDLNVLVRENLDLLAATIPKNVQLMSRISEQLPLIQGDVGQLQQVIMNLIINAAESMQNKPGTVMVMTESSTLTGIESESFSFVKEVPVSGKYAILTVQDEGVGMDEAMLSKIFDPFFTTKKSGRGLGLAALLGIVGNHKGNLEVTSEPNQGTRFRVFFPVASFPTSINEHIVPEDQESPSQLDGAVLVIDDEEPIREAVRDILSFSGVEVLTAADGLAGVAEVREHGDDIGLVLLDLSMPGMSGEETLKELLELKPELRVVISSGYEQSDVLSRLRANWKVDFLQKPYNVTDLLTCILGESALEASLLVS